MNESEQKQVDTVVTTSAGVSAVSLGAPIAVTKLGVMALGGKGIAITIAAKSAATMALVTPAAPFVLGGAAIYGTYRFFTK